MKRITKTFQVDQDKDSSVTILLDTADGELPIGIYTSSDPRDEVWMSARDAEEIRAFLAACISRARS